jgi:PAS domain S-box-containing protein
VAEEHFAGTMRTIDHVLAEALELAPAGSPISPMAFQGLMHSRMKQFAFIRNAFLVGENGFVQMDSLRGVTSIDVRDREYFTTLAADPSLPIFITAPLQSRAQTVTSIFIARPIRDIQGGFHGVLVIAVDPKLFEDELRTVLPVQGGFATLLRGDGTILSRVPDGEKWVGKVIADGPVMRSSSVSPSGVLHGSGAVDGSLRIVAYRRLADYPLVAVVGMRLNNILEAWRREAATGIGIGLLMSLLMVVMAITSDRSHAARLRGEQELRLSEEKFAKAFLGSPDALVISVAATGRYVEVNTAFCRLLGYERAELMGSDSLSLNVWVNPEDRARLVAMGARDGQTEGFETVLRRKDGSTMIVWISIQPIVVAEEACLLFICRDVSEQRAMENRSQALLARLDASNKELEQFAYVASHDLQEPLRMIAGYAQLLERRYRGRLDSDADEFIGFLVDGAKRMQALIHDLLEYSRVGRQGGAFVRFDAGEALDEVQRNLLAATRDSNGRIEIGSMPEIVADRSQIVRLFQNLIGNALKYRHSDRKPEIAVSAERIDGDWVFSVADNGIGIEPQYFERIFLVFQRLHTRDKYDGTGIGLAVCKKIVERHGGRLWIEPRPEQGSVFRFSLPAEPPVAALH